MNEVLEIKMSLDGNQWCSLIGPNLMEGIAGFGDTPLESLKALCAELETHPFNMQTFTIG